MSTFNGRTFPEPMEGITGTARDQDDLLSLDDKALAVRMLIIGLAASLNRAVSVGQPAPVVARMSKRIRNPQPGDLVMEMTATSPRHDLDHRAKSFGILIAHREEWWTTDEDWAQYIEEQRADHEEFLRGPYSQPGDEDEPFAPDDRITDHAWYIQYGPKAGDIWRWTNCTFAVVPVDAGFCHVPVGTRGGTAVTFTRDDILGGLADSGFQLRLP